MRHRQRQYCIAALASTACFAAIAETTTVELLILPNAFVVDGQPFASAKAAAAAALVKHPQHISLSGCAAMPTQRIIDVTAQLQGGVTGRMSMSVLSEGEHGCPGFGSVK